MSAPDSRRAFLRVALGGGAALAGGAFLLGESAEAASSPLDGAVGDSEVLTKLVGIEQLVVFSYRYLLPRAPGAGSTLSRFLAQERVHVRTLATALSARGAKAPPASSSLEVVDGSLASLGIRRRLAQTHSATDALKLLLEVEALEANAYHAAIEKFSSPELVRVASQLLTCDAQHATVLGERVYAGNVQRAVPHAFVPLSAELKG